MRLGKQSNAQRLRHAPNLKIPLRLTRDDEGFKNLEGKPERQKIEVLDLQSLASQAAKTAVSFGRKKRIPGFVSVLMDSPEVIEDCSSSALLAWYEISEHARPSNLVEVQMILFTAALAQLNREARLRCKSIRPDSYDGWEAAYTINDYSWMTFAPQETYILAIQALNIINQLPSDLKAMAMKMADGCSLPEAAVELGIDLFTSMRTQKEVRRIAHHISDFGAADNMFSDLKAKPRLNYDTPALPPVTASGGGE